jgi:RHS repeat-associated protein
VLDTLPTSPSNPDGPTENCYLPGNTCVQIPEGGTLYVNLNGQAGIPMGGVGALAMTLTVLPPVGSGDGYATVYPVDTPQPDTRSISFKSGERTSNNLITKIGTNAWAGWIAIYSSQETDVLLDVEGWYALSFGGYGSSFTPVTPATLVDTRPAPEAAGKCPDNVGQCTTLPANGTPLEVQVTNQASVPNDTHVTAVAVQITTWQPGSNGRLIAFAATDPTPSTRTVSMVAGKTQTSAAEVKVGTNGRIKLVSNVAVNVTVDVVGYYMSADFNAGGSVYVPVNPARLVDTTAAPPNTVGQCPDAAHSCYHALAADGSEKDINVAGQLGVPANYSAVVVNITTLHQTTAAQGGLYVHATGGQRPDDRSVTIDNTRDITQQVTVAAGTGGRIHVYTEKAVDVYVDVVGYFVPDLSTVTYAYNGNGLRKSKTVNGVQTTFTWSQAEPLPMLATETTGASTTRYIYGPGGLPVEQITTTSGGSTIYYLHHDQLGSTRLVTRADGTTAAIYSFDPYGKPTFNNPTITPFGFAGQYTDAETGFQYLRARFYDPAIAQFLTRDPLEVFTRDAYSYAGNSPVNATDPTGLCPWCIVATAFVWGAGLEMGSQMLANMANGCGGADLDYGNVIEAGLTSAAFAGAGELLALALAGGEAAEVGPTTLHGVGRIAGTSATRGGVLSSAEVIQVRAAGQLFIQADGASVRVLQTSGGFNVVIDSGGRLVTTFRHLSQHSLDRLAKGHGWVTT